MKTRPNSRHFVSGASGDYPTHVISTNRLSSSLHFHKNVQTHEMSIPAPQLKDRGNKALQEYLDKVVSDKEVPAVSLGVTNKDGELWFGCGGDRVFGEPDEGQITQDTSKSRCMWLSDENADTMQYFSYSP